MESNVTISIKDFCDAMRRSLELEADLIADRKELELQAKASGINVSAAKKWLKAEVQDEGADNPKKIAKLIEATVDQVVYGESLGHDLGMLQNNRLGEDRIVESNSNPESPSNRDVSADGKASPEAGPQAEASHVGTESGTLAGHEGRSTGEAASADLPANSRAKASEGETGTAANSVAPPDGLVSRESGGSGTATPNSSSEKTSCPQREPQGKQQRDTAGVTAGETAPHSNRSPVTSSPPADATGGTVPPQAVSPNPIEPSESCVDPVSEGKGGAAIPVTASPGPIHELETVDGVRVEQPPELPSFLKAETARR